MSSSIVWISVFRSFASCSSRLTLCSRSTAPSSFRIYAGREFRLGHIALQQLPNFVVLEHLPRWHGQVERGRCRCYLRLSNKVLVVRVWLAVPVFVCY